MKKIIVTLGALVSFTAAVFAQDDVYPAAKQSKKTAIVGATVHVGNGQVIENGTVVFDNGKTVIINCMSIWCKNNGYNYSSIINVYRKLSKNHRGIVLVNQL